MSKRALTVSILTAGLSAGLLAGAISPAAAQGQPVGGEGAYFLLSGAGNNTGKAEHIINFGDAKDEVYFGDWDDDGTDTPMVRRGNKFFVSDDNGGLQSSFYYGDAGDEVLIGDWNGDGEDSIAIRRVNKFFVKDDNTSTGDADSTFYYGDAGDIVHVGNWDDKSPAVDGVDANKDGDYTDSGDTRPAAGVDGPGDTLMVQRGNEFFVKNDVKTGVADYTFHYGDAGDTIMVGDFATPPKRGDNPDTVKKETNWVVDAAVAASSDGADQIIVRRGNVYHQSEELQDAHDAGRNPKAGAVYAYGDPTDVAFVASWEHTFDGDNDGDTTAAPDETLTGDGLGVRRVSNFG